MHKRMGLFSENVSCFYVKHKNYSAICHYVIMGREIGFHVSLHQRSQFGNHQCKATSVYDQHPQGDRELSYLPDFEGPYMASTILTPVPLRNRILYWFLQ